MRRQRGSGPVEPGGRILVFRSHSLVAALLLLPYLAWVGFAAYLNYGIWRLNP